MTTRVALVGGTGKLGGIIRGVIDDLDDFEVVAVLSSRSDLDEIAGADLVVDASTPAVSIDVVRAAIERGINVLVGTSGWSSERVALVRPLVEAERHRRRLHPELLARLGARLRALRGRRPVLPVDRDRRGAPRDEGRLAERHRRAHGRAHRRGPRRRRPRRVAARRSARPRPAGRERADPLAAPAGRRRAAGRDPRRSGGVADDHPRHRSSRRSPMPPASGSPCRPPAPRAA